METLLSNVHAPSLRQLRLQIRPIMRTSLGQEYNQSLWRGLEPLLTAGEVEVTIEVVGGRFNQRAWWTAELERTLPVLHAQSRLKVECGAGMGECPPMHS